MSGVRRRESKSLLNAVERLVMQFRGYTIILGRHDLTSPRTVAYAKRGSFTTVGDFLSSTEPLASVRDGVDSEVALGLVKSDLFKD